MLKHLAMLILVGFSIATVDDAFAGQNKGAEISMAWPSQGEGLDLAKLPADGARLSVQIHGASDIQELGLRLLWTPAQSYVVRADTTSLCGTIRPSEDKRFNGLPGYTWRIKFPARGEKSCVAFTVVGDPPGGLQPATFWIAWAYTRDSQGFVDTLVVRNAVTVRGGTPGTETTARTLLIDLGTASGGIVVLHGNVLPDKQFILQATASIVGPDTLWDGLMINGYARKRPEVRRESSVRPQTLARFALSQQVERANADFVEGQGTPPSRKQVADFIASEYRKSPLVQSATATYDRSDDTWVIQVCYGEHDCEKQRLARQTERDVPPTRRDLILSESQQLLRYLREGRIVFISNGAVFAPQPNQVEEYQREIEALKAGNKVPESSLIPARRIAAEVKTPPVTLATLRQAGVGR